jgi:hypothetical protein
MAAVIAQSLVVFVPKKKDVLGFKKKMTQKNDVLALA